MNIRSIEHGSHEYDQMIRLRIVTLLEPIGVPSSFIKQDDEKGDFLIGAFENGTLIGCCVLSPRGGSIVQLRQMAVDTDHQGKGVGAAILTFAETVAAQNGFQVVMMHARDAVIGFYQSCGYTIAGERFFEVGIAHHVMEKTLRSSGHSQ